jgi:hypothetical protein
MTSPVLTTRTAAGQWEVRTNDGNNTLLGSFENKVFCDLFLEAVLGLVGKSDFPIEPLTAAGEQTTRRLQTAA